MFMGQISAKHLMVCNAIIDILHIFADTEIGGQYDIDYTALSKYLNSLKCVSDYFECETKEDVYERFTEDVYNGLPIWRFLILPKWTKTMVEASFEQECQTEYKIMQNKYKCLTCTFHKVVNTQVGVITECTYKEPFKERRGVPKRKEYNNLKTHCEHYQRGTN